MGDGDTPRPFGATLSRGELKGFSAIRKAELPLIKKYKSLKTRYLSLSGNDHSISNVTFFPTGTNCSPVGVFRRLLGRKKSTGQGARRLMGRIKSLVGVFRRLLGSKKTTG